MAKMNWKLGLQLDLTADCWGMAPMGAHKAHKVGAGGRGEAGRGMPSHRAGLSGVKVGFSGLESVSSILCVPCPHCRL